MTPFFYFHGVVLVPLSKILAVKAKQATLENVYVKWQKNNLTCFWAISEVFWFEPILSMPSKKITPRWALDKSKSALRYNFDITELIVSLFSSHPDINSIRLPRRFSNGRAGGRTFELFLPFNDFSAVRAQRSETALRNNGDFWASGLKQKN